MAPGGDNDFSFSGTGLMAYRYSVGKFKITVACEIEILSELAEVGRLKRRLFDDAFCIDRL